MTTRYSSELERPTGETVPIKCGRRGGSEPLSLLRCPRILSPRFPAIPAIIPQPRESRRQHWETIATWSFAVFTFAALLLCLYLIQAKCAGTWPFQATPQSILKATPH